MERAELERFSGPMVELYNQIELEMLKKLGKALMFKTELLEEDPEAWIVQQLQMMGMLDQQNIRILQQYSGKTVQEINAMLVGSGVYDLEETEEDIKDAIINGAQLAVPPPINQSPQILAIMDAYQAQAASKLNLVNTTLLDQSKQVYIDGLNKAALEVRAGFKSHDQVLREVIKGWVDKGVPALIRSDGAKLGVEGYVRTVVISTMNNMTNELQDQRNKDYGIELVEISSHAGNRPGCRPYAGRIFSLQPGHIKYPYLYDRSIGRIGDPDSLFGINCGHKKYAFVEGMSTRTYKPPKSKREDQKVYEQSQMQRKLERDIRKAKNQLAVFEAANDNEGIKESKQLIRDRQLKMREFIEATGRTRRNYREQIHT